MADVDVRIYGPVVVAMSLPGGMVWKYAFQRRRSVERIAKLNCPKRTWALHDSIQGHYEPAPPEHVIMTVSADKPYAASVHQGARPHVIRGKKGGGLAFFWVERGIVFSGPKVNHPGIRVPQPFLAEALREVMRRL